MKFLFICRANIGRSQAAEGFCNDQYPGSADSAGTIVETPGETISDRPGAINVIKVMQEYGIDISKKIRTQLTEAMTAQYDKLIVMAEPETMPEWLKSNPKTEIWTIQDPKGQDMNTSRAIVGQIKERIKILI